MEWPESFYAVRRGEGCPMCAEGRPDDNGYGLRIHAGAVSDAYLQRADVQRGYTIVVWRGRHVAEPTELSETEAAAYWREVLLVGLAVPVPRGRAARAAGGPVSGRRRGGSRAAQAQPVTAHRRRAKRTPRVLR